MADTNTWIFNMVQANWRDCVDGPTNANDHGNENVGNPWQGVSHDSPSPVARLNKDDLVLARVKGEGINGIWEYHDRAKVNSQSVVPWNDAQYEWVLYCRPLHREFSNTYKEHFLSGPQFGAIGTAASNLTLDYKEKYLKNILNDVTLNSSAKSRIEEELGLRIAPAVGDSEEKSADFKSTNRVETTITRPIRNTEMVNKLKNRYNHSCQVCGEQRQRSTTEPYAEGHHLHPLGENGPGEKSNILILCPNHHADFDYGVIEVERRTYTISHLYDDSVDGTTLSLNANHDILDDHLEYHNSNISII